MKEEQSYSDMHRVKLAMAVHDAVSNCTKLHRLRAIVHDNYDRLDNKEKCLLYTAANFWRGLAQDIAGKVEADPNFVVRNIDEEETSLFDPVATAIRVGSLTLAASQGPEQFAKACKALPDDLLSHEILGYVSSEWPTLDEDMVTVVYEERKYRGE